MRRGCMLFVLFFMSFPLPANAGEELGRCNASILTEELVAEIEPNFDGDEFFNRDEEVILQGLAMMHYPYDGAKWILEKFSKRANARIADCSEGSCGGPNRTYQICYSKLEAFTDASTQGGEQCSSDEDIPRTGEELQPDQTWWMLTIERSLIGETKYCQIEVKTLASGQGENAEPPGTGDVRCVGLKPGDPCSGPVNELPDIIQPGDEIVDGDLNGPRAPPAIPTPALSSWALAVLAGVMGWLGIARSRRRRALR